MPASLFDVNVWVAATFPTHPFHASAVAALEAATEDDPIGFCRATQISFLRLATTPRLLQLYAAENLTNSDAIAILQIFLSRPTVTEFEELAGISVLWHRLASRETASPKVWVDRDQRES